MSSETARTSLAAVLEDLAAIFRQWSPGADGGACEAFDDRRFNAWAGRVHEMQRKTNPVLRRFWGEAGSAPATWQDVPPVPAAAFKDIAIVSGKPERLFRTSGTSAGSGRRGHHHVVSMALYRAAARANYRGHLIAGARSLMVVSLIPSPVAAPDSSLAAMAGFIAGEPEVVGNVWAFDPKHGVDASVVRRAAECASEPVLLLATAFALVQLLDALAGNRLELPAGSRVMETGGFKGRVAEVSREDLYRRAEDQLGVPGAATVNEYGMTELLSQAYDGVAGSAFPVDERAHRFPPWVRTKALHPATLSPLPPGETGLLAHFDLANAGSVCHVLTEDLGETTEDGAFRLRGRAGGAELRGCSLSAESFLRAIRRPAR